MCFDRFICKQMNFSSKIEENRDLNIYIWPLIKKWMHGLIHIFGLFWFLYV